MIKFLFFCFLMGHEFRRALIFIQSKDKLSYIAFHYALKKTKTLMNNKKLYAIFFNWQNFYISNIDVLFPLALKQLKSSGNC